jgi:hypothetical protein
MKKSYYLLGLLVIVFGVLLWNILDAEVQVADKNKDVRIKNDVQDDMSVNESSDLSVNGANISLLDTIFDKQIKEDIKGKNLESAIQYIRSSISDAVINRSTSKTGTTDSATFILRPNSTPVCLFEGRKKIGRIVLRKKDDRRYTDVVFKP